MGRLHRNFDIAEIVLIAGLILAPLQTPAKAQQAPRPYVRPVKAMAARPTACP